MRGSAFSRYEQYESLRHLPRRLSSNCDLRFANSDVFKENYSIKLVIMTMLMQQVLNELRHIDQYDKQGSTL